MWYIFFGTVNLGGDTGGGDQDDEDKDTIGETRFMKPIKATRSSTLLHSVEDLSTDSSCLFKARNGFDSNRSSSRRRAVACGVGVTDTGNATTTASTKNGTGFSTDEFLDKVPLNINTGNLSSRKYHSAKQAAAYRGLSKSMILPTPASDLSAFDDTIKTEERKSCCDKIKRFAINFRTFEHGSYILYIFFINIVHSFIFILYYQYSQSCTHVEPLASFRHPFRFERVVRF